MKYADCGFRPLYKNFCIFPLNSIIRKALEDHPGIDEAEGVMVYGYVDHEAGNTVELVALTKKMDDVRQSFIKLTDSARYFIRIESIKDEEFQYVDHGNSPMYEPFKSKIDLLAPYDVNENLAKSRAFAFLDEFRYEKNFDDVKIVLYKEGLRPEGVWAKIESLDNGSFIGTLLNEPNQDFGVSMGDPVAFIMNENKDKEKSLVADLTPHREYTAEELADGKILKKVITEFNENQNKLKLYEILEILKNSTVYAPYSKKGVEVLTSKHKTFFPAFSSQTEMWQYENDIVKTEMPFSEVIKKAAGNNKYDGIVVNAFSDSFVIPRNMFEMLDGMKSSAGDSES